MAGDVRRSGGQWGATGGAPTGGLAPPGAVHLPRPSRGSSLRRSTATDGRSDASACAADAGTARTAACRRGHARCAAERAPAFPSKFQFADTVSNLIFSEI
jgi:hypothetical protein